MSETYTAVIFGREREILGWTEKETLALADGSQLAVVPMGNVTLPGKIWRIARLRFEDGNWWLDGQILPTAYFEDGIAYIDKRDCPPALCYFEDGNWCLDEHNRPIGPCLTPDNDPAKFEFARLTHLETIAHLACVLKRVESPTRIWHHLIVAVAWLKDHFGEIGIPKNLSLSLTATKQGPPKAIDRITEEFGEPPPENPRPQAKRYLAYLPYLLTRCDFIVSTQNLPAQMDTGPVWFTVTSAAKYAGVTKRTIRNWIRDEWLKGVEKQGRKIRIARTELDKCRNRQ
jgi:excisionase family DNA binding protein